MFIAIELLRALETLHACHIVHGGIQPSSVLLRNETSGDVTHAQVSWNAAGAHGWDARGVACAVAMCCL